MPHANRAPPRPPQPDDVMRKLTALMPGDLWLYEYAKRLVRDGREKAQLPPLPHMGCRSSSHVLQCEASSAMGAVRHLWKTSVAEDIYHTAVFDAAKQAWDATNFTVV